MLNKIRTLFQARACSTERPSSAPRNLPETVLPKTVLRDLQHIHGGEERLREDQWRKPFFETLCEGVARDYLKDPEKCLQQVDALKEEFLKAPNASREWLWMVASQDRREWVHHIIVRHPNAPIQFLATSSPYTEVRIRAIRRDIAAVNPELRPMDLEAIAQWAVPKYVETRFRTYFELLECVADHPEVFGDASKEFRVLSREEQHRLLDILKRGSRWHAVWILIRDTSFSSVGNDGAKYLIDRYPHKICSVTIKYIWEAASPEDRERMLENPEWRRLIEELRLWKPWLEPYRA